MSERQGWQLLDAIRLDPYDELARLAYADWLEEEKGDPMRHAEFIRLSFRDRELARELPRRRRAITDFDRNPVGRTQEERLALVREQERVFRERKDTRHAMERLALEMVSNPLAGTRRVRPNCPRATRWILDTLLTPPATVMQLADLPQKLSGRIGPTALWREYNLGFYSSFGVSRIYLNKYIVAMFRSFPITEVRVEDLCPYRADENSWRWRCMNAGASFNSEQGDGELPVEYFRWLKNGYQTRHRVPESYAANYEGCTEAMADLSRAVVNRGRECCCLPPIDFLARAQYEEVLPCPQNDSGEPI